MYTMKESVAVAKQADAKKGVLPTKSDKSIQRLRDEPERQLGSLRGVIGNIRRDGGTPSVDSIATELSGMHSALRAPVLLALQQTHGNRYVQRVVSGIQAKLVVGQTGDKYEQEADQVADEVMWMPEPQVQRQANEEKEKLPTQATTIIPIPALTLQRQDDGEKEELKKKKKEEEKEIITAKGHIGLTPEVTSDIESHIHSLRGGGQPLAESVRNLLEPRFGYDFSQVRVHMDSRATESAQSIGARAYTVGQDIVFGKKQYAPATDKGQRLLAHELTHVIQQTHGITGSDQTLESQADTQENYGSSSRLYTSVKERNPITRLQLKPDRITAITVNLATSTVTISIDDGSTISGSVRHTNLTQGNYRARWDSSNGLEINPLPTQEDVIDLEVSGTYPFLRRYARLRSEITQEIPFNVISQPSAEAAPISQPEQAAALSGYVRLTPEEAQRRCRSGDLPGIMTFPVRLPRGIWRIDDAPIRAWREGGEIVVQQPPRVPGTRMFQTETRTLPFRTFMGGMRLQPNELVRVRLYDVGGEPVQCTTGEGMLALSRATDRATFISILATSLEAVMFFVPVGGLAMAAGRAVRPYVAAAMIGMGRAAPTALELAASRTAVTAVERRAVAGVVQQAMTRTMTRPATQALEQAAVRESTGAVTRAALPSATRGLAIEAAGRGTGVAAIEAAARVTSVAAIARLPGPYTILVSNGEGGVFSTEDLTSIRVRDHPRLADLQASLRPVNTVLESARMTANANTAFIRVIGPDGATFTRGIIRYNSERATLSHFYHELNHLGDFVSGRVPPTHLIEADAQLFRQLSGESNQAVYETAIRMARPLAERPILEVASARGRRAIAEVKNRLRDIESGFQEGFSTCAIEREQSVLSDLTRRGQVRGVTEVLDPLQRATLRDNLRTFIRESFPELPGEFQTRMRANFWRYFGLE